MRETFDVVNRSWLESARTGRFEDGSTTLCILLSNNMLMVANTGDSRALLYQGGQTVVLSKDHVPSDKEEGERIVKLGGSVIGGRLQGKLGVSRAFGDYLFKETNQNYLVVEPDIKKFTLTVDVEFLVVGCDGLYEEFQNDEIIEFIRTRLERKDCLQKIVQDLVEEAIDRGALDNITVIVVKFEKVFKTIIKKYQKIKNLAKSQTLIPKGKDACKQTGLSLRTSGKHPISTTGQMIAPTTSSTTTITTTTTQNSSDLTKKGMSVSSKHSLNSISYKSSSPLTTLEPITNLTKISNPSEDNYKSSTSEKNSKKSYDNTVCIDKKGKQSKPKKELKLSLENLYAVDKSNSSHSQGLTAKYLALTKSAGGGRRVETGRSLLTKSS